jgi:cytochrome c
VTAFQALALVGLVTLPTLALAQAGEMGDARRGALLIAQYQCGACHVIPGMAAARGAEGPPLTSFGLRSYIAGRVPNRPDLLARWIARPSDLVPSATMPDMGVPAQDARDMAAWLTGLR